MSDTTSELRSAGLKATLPRMKILELFENSPCRHFTADDIHRHFLAEKLDIGLATIYRVLTQFEQAGLLERHHFESGRAIYEIRAGSHHDHLVCVDCGRVEEFHDEEIEKRQRKIARERGFAIEEHTLSLYARCLKENCPHRRQAGPEG